MASKKNSQKPAPAAAAGNANVNTLQAVLALFKDSGLHELEFEDAAVHVRLTRTGTTTAAEAPRAVQLPAPMHPSNTQVTQPAAAPHPHVQATHKAADEPTGGHIITSPFVGTFYRAANPTAAPFVQVGSVVKKGQTLCIIEAMKLMNEIEADESGKVLEILAENAAPVEFGQKLFRIVPT